MTKTTTTDDEAADVLPAVIDTTGGGLDRMPSDGEVLPLIATDDEWGDVSDGDLAPRAVRIPHLSLDRNIGGGFVNPDTGEKMQELVFVWLAKGASRAWFALPFGRDGDAEKSPSCRSFDGQHADPNSPWRDSETWASIIAAPAYAKANPDGVLPDPDGNCATCPLGKWHGSQRPQCSEAVEALVFLPDPMGVGQLGRLRFGGITVRPALDYWGSFKIRVPSPPPMAFVSKVELVPTDTDFGVKLGAKFSRLGRINRREAQPLIDERDRRLADWRADIAESVATAEAGEVHDTPAPGPFDGPSGNVTDLRPGEEPF